MATNMAKNFNEVKVSAMLDKLVCFLSTSLRAEAIPGKTWDSRFGLEPSHPSPIRYVPKYHRNGFLLTYRMEDTED